LTVYINGEPREVSDNLSLADLISQLDLPKVRIAAELNNVVVRRGDWSGTALTNGDRLEIVHFVGGG